jgi:P-type Mg2+ transporter
VRRGACPGARRLDAEFAAGNRVVAVATRAAPGQAAITGADEHGLELRGLLVFLDPPKATARRALDRLARLGVTVKVLTGDNPAVAAKVCADLGLPAGRVATGADIDAAGDRLSALLAEATVFARVSPEHKARIVREQRRTGVDVAFLGDGANDAIALHAADVGISVESATDVAKDAADVLLLEKDLDVLADGVMEGRRIFANTMKYVLTGTSSNFGNMFSAAGASLFLSFLAMLPSQILLNNLLYGSSQLAIPTDKADPEQLARPSRWDVGFIRRFMLFFGPVSSVFDFATFGVMLWIFHAGAPLFRSGWFVESLATQTLVIFAIRTRRIPFFRSHPSVPLLLAAIGAVTVGALLPATPLARTLGFQPLPGLFFVALALMVACYLALIEIGKLDHVRHADVVVATPGRLTDLIEQHICTLARIEITVLDEADHMADPGFLPAVTQLLDQTQASAPSTHSRPDTRGYSWPPTSPPAASTSTTSTSSCSSTRRKTTRTTCTAPAAQRVLAPPARSSRWSSADRSAICSGCTPRPGSPPSSPRARR